MSSSVGVQVTLETPKLLPSWKQGAQTPDVNRRDSSFVLVQDNLTDNSTTPTATTRSMPPPPLRISEPKRDSHISMISGIATRQIPSSPQLSITPATNTTVPSPTSPTTSLPEPATPINASPQPRRRLTSFTGNRKVSMVEVSDRNSVLIDGEEDGRTIDVNPAPWEANAVSPTLQNLSCTTTAAQTDSGVFLEYAKAVVATHLGVDQLPPPRPTTAPPAALLARSNSRPTLVRSPTADGQMVRLQRVASLQSVQVKTEPLKPNNSLRPANATRAIGGIPDATALRQRAETAPENHTLANATMGGWQSSYTEVFGARRPMLAPAAPTDPQVIQAITQTMIGEYLFKFTTRSIMGGTSERKHRRFFWVHPYTKTLYWSTKAPGTDVGTFSRSVSTAKSACILSVRVFLEGNHSDGLASYYIVIATPKRHLKIKAEDDDRHHIWLRALSYLQSRSNGPATPIGTTTSMLFNSPTQLQRITLLDGDDTTTTATRTATASNRQPQSPSRPSLSIAIPSNALTTTGTNGLHSIPTPTPVSARSATGHHPGLSAMASRIPHSNTAPTSRSIMSRPSMTRLFSAFHSHTPSTHRPNRSLDEDDLSDEEDIANLLRCCDGKHDVSHLSKH
ncbi:meiotic cell cortex C-terminal pleckstrin homology-domain-containing protein [Syncephalis fuscata]|nr:meiotic cell cortex C-terminal pleckstrin homology-domain-containing protein [Syncephalis fuscata]